MKRIWDLIKGAASSFAADFAMSMAAALAYYTTFSIAPMLFIVISLAGLVFGEEAARGEIFGQLRGLIGDEGAIAIQSMVASVNEPAKGILGTITGAVILLIGATTVFAELQNALDRIWRAPARESISGIWSLVRARLLSFGMILGIGFLLIVSLIASAALAAFGKWWGPMFGSWEVLAQILNVALSFALFTTAFALIYKYIPRVRIEWRDVWTGAAVTALLFAIGKLAIGLYIGKSAIASGFGAAGSVIVVLVWVYYSALIFLFGAEFTWVYAHTFGSRKGMQPKQRNEVPQRPQAKPGAAVPAALAPAAAAASNRAGQPALPATAPVLPGYISAPMAFGLGCILTALLALLPTARKRADRHDRVDLAGRRG
jgi:membrane protein